MDVSKTVALMCATLFIAVLGQTPAVFANDCVTPSEDVVNGVQLRAGPSTKTNVVGKLKLGQYQVLAGSVPTWHQITTSDGQTAFISKRWSIVASCPSTVGGAPLSATEGTSYAVHVIDVGTGLAVLIRGADFAVLYDGGSNDDTALGDQNRLVAYLKTLTPTLTRIDHVILSHPHRDHVELLADVLDRYDIGDVWDSGASNDICGYRRYAAAVSNHPAIRFHTPLQNFGPRTYSFQGGNCNAPEKVKVSLSSRIDESPIQLGQGAAMTFLHTDGTQKSNLNENSLVVRMDLGGKRVLFMGDAEAGGRHSPDSAPAQDSTEGKLLNCCRGDLKSDAMIAGHHGSATSSRDAFLDAVGAKLFVISAGPTKYTSVVLPDQIIVDDLSRRGQVFRTDVNDEACKTNPSKIGPDADGNPGGCTNVLLEIDSTGVRASYLRKSD